MRYPQGGGLIAERQAFRERVRMEAVGICAEGRGSTDIAKELRVSVRSVQRWRRAWLVAGQDAVRSRGPTAPSLTPTTSSADCDTTSARSSAAATSPTVASPPPASH
ncbi:helix-turn-helix domain-containing protein [Streptomyces sp. TBY4]|uniref:helix-turn-helix domain-containing protein n=1 Tax=Streptomyces sp. TBY4 TaxID=2962030 RepID=UPI0027E525AD|nr:helix-turn-helix domain-containing protein [Streptomyces sp. TBY4]